MSKKKVVTSAIGIDAYIGKSVMIRSATHYYTGKLMARANGYLVLGEAAWIPETGRFAASLLSGELEEIEPFPGECIVSEGAIVDISPWNHPLPRQTK